MDTSASRLRLQNISMAFPGAMALSGVNLVLRAGEIHGLLGQNGAGKSTVVKFLSGAEQPTGGRIFVEDQLVSFVRPADAQAAGIHTIFQEFSLVPGLSVAENIYLSDMPLRRGLVDWRRLRAMAKKVLASIGYDDIDVNALVGAISVAEQQIVEIAKAVHHRSKIILLDEPTASLPKSNGKKLFRLLRQLRSGGVSLFYITHHLDEVHEICDRISVLRNGRHVTTQPISAVSEDQIVSLMLGKEAMTKVAAETERRVKPTSRAAPVLSAPTPAFEIRHLSDASLLCDISLRVMPGEAVAVTGLVGSGQLQLAACAFGAQKRTVGDVLLKGVAIPPNAPRASVRAGLGWIPEERKTQGLVLNMSVSGNLALSSLQRIARMAIVSRRRELAAAASVARSLGIRTPSLSHAVRTLSGGNQQKVVFGKWMRARSHALILSDPTRGVDVGAREEIYREIREFLRRGGAALVVTSDVDEALRFDRIFVISRGRLVGEFLHGQVDHARFVSLLR
jgi:ribose transport system ATP-binding protein